MSMMVSFVLSFFPRDVLDEILNLIESVSEDFPSYSWTKEGVGAKGGALNKFRPTNPRPWFCFCYPDKKIQLQRKYHTSEQEETI